MNSSAHPFCIRAAGTADAAMISLLSEQLGYRVSAGHIASRLGALPADREAVLVGEVDGQVVGWIQVGIGFAIESSAHVEIRGLVVLDSHRGLGLGRQLVNAGEAWARQLGFGEMRVRSNTTRAATHTFYKQLGFGESKQQVVFVRQLPEN